MGVSSFIIIPHRTLNHLSTNFAVSNMLVSDSVLCYIVVTKSQKKNNKDLFPKVETNNNKLQTAQAQQRHTYQIVYTGITHINSCYALS